MQTVQLSSFRAITPRPRRRRIASFSCGYCTVTAPSSMVLKVVLEALDDAERRLDRPLDRFGQLRLRHGRPPWRCRSRGCWPSESGMRNFQANAWSWSSRKRGSVKRTQKMMNPSEHDLGEHDPQADTLPQPGDMPPVGAHPREPPPAEEEHRGQAGEGEGGGELADEEDQEAQAGVLGHDTRRPARIRPPACRTGVWVSSAWADDHEDEEPDELGDDEQAEALEAEQLEVGLGAARCSAG